MRHHLSTVLDYFAYFSYAPSFQEIYAFFPRKISVQTLKIYLHKEVLSGFIIPLSHNRYFRPSRSSSYTIPQYSIFMEKNIKKSIRLYLRVLSLLPQVLYVGVTGASAMNGYRADDDLDLCIVAKGHSIWTTRFFAVSIAKIFGIHTRTGVCLNLFFEAQDLSITPEKQNSYIAHELIQMKTLVDKNDVHERFFHNNLWIYNYCPNLRTRKPSTSDKQPLSEKGIITCVITHVDRLFKSIQLPIIKRNRTSLFISSGQLWLFKNDFEKKLKRHGLVI